MTKLYARPTCGCVCVCVWCIRFICDVINHPEIKVRCWHNGSKIHVANWISDVDGARKPLTSDGRVLKTDAVAMFSHAEDTLFINSRDPWLIISWQWCARPRTSIMRRSLRIKRFPSGILHCYEHHNVSSDSTPNICQMKFKRDRFVSNSIYFSK